MRILGSFLLLSAAVAAGDSNTPAQDDVKPGLVGEYFQLDDAIEDFPSVEGKKPNLRRIDKQVNWDSTDEEFADSKMSEHFYVRWTGILRVPKDGKYTIYTESDDGSRLWIGDKKVVDNGGLHGMEEKSGEIELKAGDVALKADFFENEGGAGMKILWEGAGLSKEAIPASALFHKKDADLDK
jgi:hypothetical protein